MGTCTPSFQNLAAPVYTFTSTYMCLCIYMHTDEYTYTSTPRVSILLHLCVYTCVNMYLSNYTHIHTHIHVYMCIHIYVHTCPSCSKYRMGIFRIHAYIYRTKNFLEYRGCRTRALETSACVCIHTHVDIFTWQVRIHTHRNQRMLTPAHS